MQLAILSDPKYTHMYLKKLQQSPPASAVIVARTFPTTLPGSDINNSISVH